MLRLNGNLPCASRSHFSTGLNFTNRAHPLTRLTQVFSEKAAWPSQLTCLRRTMSGKVVVPESPHSHGHVRKFSSIPTDYQRGDFEKSICDEEITLDVLHKHLAYQSIVAEMSRKYLLSQSKIDGHKDNITELEIVFKSKGAEESFKEGVKNSLIPLLNKSLEELTDKEAKHLITACETFKEMAEKKADRNAQALFNNFIIDYKTLLKERKEKQDGFLARIFFKFYHIK